MQIILKLTRWIFIAQFFLALVIYFYASIFRGGGQGTSILIPIILHVGGNVLITLSFFVAFGRKIEIRSALMALIICALVAEIGQAFNPVRTFDISDIVANVSGVIIGLFLVFIARFLARKIALRFKSETA